MTKPEIRVAECVAFLRKTKPGHGCSIGYELAQVFIAHLFRLEVEGGGSEQVAERPIVDASAPPDRGRPPGNWIIAVDPFSPARGVDHHTPHTFWREGWAEPRTFRLDSQHPAFNVADLYYLKSDDGALAPEQLSPPPILNPSQNPPETET